MTAACRIPYNGKQVGFRTRIGGGGAVHSAAGAIPEKAISYQLLRRFLGGNRYGSRDEAEGGDDWAQPSVADFIDLWGNLVWGDFSNMNGGPFPPHASHRTGNDVDGWFNGYNARDANTAETILGHLTSNQGSRIAIVFVTYRAQRGNTFYDAIRGVTLNDGRNATDVIQPVNGHTGHFHWRVTDE